MSKIAHVFIVFIFIFYGCINNESELPLNIEFMEKESMFLFQMDNDSLIFTPIIKSIEKRRFKYELSYDTLILFNYHGWNKTNFTIQFMNSDSIKFTDCTPDSIPVYKREYAFYKRTALYDSTLFLKSITIEKRLSKGGEPDEAFILSDSLDLFIRKDLGIIETSLGHYSHRMTDSHGGISDSTFNYIQDLVRFLDFQIIDDKFNEFSISHVYWNVEIEFKNGKKYSNEGIDIADNLGQLWAYILYTAPKSIELSEINNIDGVSWKEIE